MSTAFVCPDCLAVVPHEDYEVCVSCSFVQPKDGWLPDPLTGLILGGRYRLEDRLGEGGMACVFRASRIGMLGGKVAVKVLAPRFSRTVIARRFEREAKIVSRLSNPHVVRIYDFDTFTLPGSDQQLYFIAMELVVGRSLSEVLDKQDQVNVMWALDILRQAARGLEEAHRAGITHRDLKPSNIMLVEHRDSTHVKIVDFGIAALQETPGGEHVEKLTQTGFVSGTPDYMAPEQAIGKGDIGPPADIYALGVIAYEMLSGRKPFEGHSMIDVLMKRVTNPAPSLRDVVDNPNVPRELVRLVDHMLATDPNQRQADAAALLDDLARFPMLHTRPGFVVPQGVLDPDTVPEGPSPVGGDVAQLANTVVATSEDPQIHEVTKTASVVRGAVPGSRSRAPLWITLAVLICGGGAAAAIVLTQSNGNGSGPPSRPADPPPIAATKAPPTPSTPEPTTAETPTTAPTKVPPPPTTPPPADPVEDPVVDDPAEIPVAAPPEVKVEMDGPRPALEEGFREFSVTRGDDRLDIGLPHEAPALYLPLQMRLASSRLGGDLRAREAEATMTLLKSGQRIGSVSAEARASDGRVAMALPARPVASDYRVAVSLTLVDGTRQDFTFILDARTGEVRPLP